LFEVQLAKFLIYLSFVVFFLYFYYHPAHIFHIYTLKVTLSSQIDKILKNKNLLLELVIYDENMNKTI